MIVTAKQSADIIRYLVQSASGTPNQWTTLCRIADHLHMVEDVSFGQAVDLARCRGWLIVEGTSVKRACLTKAGRSLVGQVGGEQSTLSGGAAGYQDDLPFSLTTRLVSNASVLSSK
jgi:hypothetical protein